MVKSCLTAILLKDSKLITTVESYTYTYVNLFVPFAFVLMSSYIAELTVTLLTPEVEASAAWQVVCHPLWGSSIDLSVS